MSVWTHVAAVFRIDGIQEFGKPNFEEIFGKQCLWNDSGAVWEDACKNPEKYLPMGSEGTLETSVWVNPRGNELAAYTVTVFGDLRDFNDIEFVEKWFDNSCRKAENVRQAVVTIECENGEVIVKKHEEESDDKF